MLPVVPPRPPATLLSSGNIMYNVINFLKDQNKLKSEVRIVVRWVGISRNGFKVCNR